MIFHDFKFFKNIVFSKIQTFKEAAVTTGKLKHHKNESRVNYNPPGFL